MLLKNQIAGSANIKAVTTISEIQQKVISDVTGI